MKMNKFSNINTFMGMENPYDKSDIVVYGAGFDGTTSNRPGARFASSSMRPEFYGLETYSPILELDLEDFKICDMGDLDLSIGDTDKVLQEIYEGTKQIIQDNKIPFMIGGEHLVTLPAFKAVYEKYEDVYILHFDAHTDLREEYNNNKNSHATVIKRIWDIVGDNKIYQFGIRSGEREEFCFAREHTNLNKFNFTGLSKAIEACRGYPVYFTIDLDVLDPSVFPGTGTPEAGGVTFMELLEAMIVVSELNVVAMDINELSPVYDQSGGSTAVACKVLRELLLAMNKGENK